MKEKKWTQTEHVTLKKGGLHGWHANNSEESRHRALADAVRADSYATVIERLNALIGLTERTQPHVSKTATKDREWLEHNRQGRE